MIVKNLINHKLSAPAGTHLGALEKEATTARHNWHQVLRHSRVSPPFQQLFALLCVKVGPWLFPVYFYSISLSGPAWGRSRINLIITDWRVSVPAQSVFGKTLDWSYDDVNARTILLQEFVPSNEFSPLLIFPFRMTRGVEHCWLTINLPFEDI